MDDQTLWRLFLNGDKDAFSRIFLDHYNDLFNYGKKLSNNDNLTKDSIQDLFLKLWKNRKNLTLINIIKPYLFKSLRHHILDSLELHRPWQSIEDTSEALFEITYSYEDFLINDQTTEENRIKVANALNKLPSRQREAIYLRYFENLDFEIIAQVMEMNIQSVRNTIHRAMQLMREII